MGNPIRRLVPVDDFKAELTAPEPKSLDDVFLRKEFTTEVKAIEGGDVEIVVSTATPDRSGDVVNPRGARLENFEKNPVVLWAHDGNQLPVAKAKRIWIEGDGIRSIPEFTPRDMYPFGATVGEMVKAGFLNAASIGFLPIKYVFNEDRAGFMPMDFEEWELLEYSIVPIPANPEALIAAKSAGIDLAPLREWAVKLLDGEGGLWIPKAAIEAAWKHSVPSKTISVPAPSAPQEGDVDANEIKALTERLDKAAERAENAAKALADAEAKADAAKQVTDPDLAAKDIEPFIREAVAEAVKQVKQQITGKLD